jgi:hypothetical protein
MDTLTKPKNIFSNLNNYENTINSGDCKKLKDNI